MELSLQTWQQRGDPVLHIDLRRWADILVIAPLDANTLAKVANGICDNLLVGFAFYIGMVFHIVKHVSGREYFFPESLGTKMLILPKLPKIA